MRKHYLIVLTGIDGSGKTTQAKMLTSLLTDKGIDAFYVWGRWEPVVLRFFVSWWKKKKNNSAFHARDNYKTITRSKQRLLNNNFVRWLWLALFLLEYSMQIFMRLLLALSKHRVVICDRLHYDSIVDQAINLGRHRNFLLNNLDSLWMKTVFPVPDVVIYIDCPEDIAFRRKNDNSTSVEYLKERREVYLYLADRYGWFKINGAQNTKDVFLQVKNIVRRWIDV